MVDTDDGCCCRWNVSAAFSMNGEQLALNKIILWLKQAIRVLSVREPKKAGVISYRFIKFNMNKCFLDVSRKGIDILMKA